MNKKQYRCLTWPTLVVAVLICCGVNPYTDGGVWVKEWLPGPSGADVACVACVDVARNRRDTVKLKTVKAILVGFGRWRWWVRVSKAERLKLVMLQKPQGREGVKEVERMSQGNLHVRSCIRLL